MLSFYVMCSNKYVVRASGRRLSLRVDPGADPPEDASRAMAPTGILSDGECDTPDGETGIADFARPEWLGWYEFPPRAAIEYRNNSKQRPTVFSAPRFISLVRPGMACAPNRVASNIAGREHDAHCQLQPPIDTAGSAIRSPAVLPNRKSRPGAPEPGLSRAFFPRTFG